MISWFSYISNLYITDNWKLTFDDFKIIKFFHKYKNSISNTLIRKLNKDLKKIIRFKNSKKRRENVNKTSFYYKLLNSHRICKGHHSSQVKCQAILITRKEIILTFDRQRSANRCRNTLAI